MAGEHKVDSAVGSSFKTLGTMIQEDIIFRRINTEHSKLFGNLIPVVAVVDTDEMDVLELGDFVAERLYFSATDEGHSFFHSEVAFVIASDKKNRGSEAV